MASSSSADTLNANDTRHPPNHNQQRRGPPDWAERQATNLERRQEKIKEAKIKEAKIKEAKIKEAKIKEAMIKEAKIKEAKIKEAKL